MSQFQLRFRAPAGTKFESTERLATDVLDEIKQAAGPNNVEITLGYVGVQPSSYPINTIFLWTGGSHEGVLQVALKPEAGIRLTDFEETLRGRFSERFPTAQFSFEPGDIVNRIMNFGTSTPVEVAITGPDFAASRTFAAKVREELGADSRASRSAVRPGARLPGDSGRREPSDGRPTGGDRRSGRTLLRRGDLVQPVRRAELLGRSAHGHRVPGADRSATTAR